MRQLSEWRLKPSPGHHEPVESGTRPGELKVSPKKRADGISGARRRKPRKSIRGQQRRLKAIGEIAKALRRQGNQKLVLVGKMPVGGRLGNAGLRRKAAKAEPVQAVPFQRAERLIDQSLPKSPVMVGFFRLHHEKPTPARQSGQCQQ